MGKERVLLSVCMITYNHDSYISQAIEGVLMQKCNFRFEIAVGEDNSADNTLQIITTYASKYPDLIKLRHNESNLGAIPNFIKTIEECNGKYIAVCEGDDYWTDPYKLQKQVDFLEANDRYSMCLHNSMMLKGNRKMEVILRDYDEDKIYQTEDIITGKAQVITHSIVFRRASLNLPSWFNYVQQGDLALMLLLSLTGPVYYFNGVMGVYRKHATSLGATSSAVNSALLKMDLYSYFDYYSKFEFHELIMDLKESSQEKLYYQFLKSTGKFRKYINYDYYLFKFKHLVYKIAALITNIRRSFL